ncbi:MAG TPA: hypothetical protein VNN25_08885 [Thermoanaerobaculia bacterium]|nr:hypothetical protein [Thermoanaerobaculia bacterium]
MRSARIGKPRSASPGSFSLSRKLPRLSLPLSAAAATPARPRPSIGKPGRSLFSGVPAGKPPLRDPVNPPRNGRK